MCFCFTQIDGVAQASHPGGPEDALFRSQEELSGERIPVLPFDRVNSSTDAAGKNYRELRSEALVSTGERHAEMK